MGPHHLLVDLGKLADFIDMKNEHTFGKKSAIGLKCVGVFELWYRSDRSDTCIIWPLDCSWKTNQFVGHAMHHLSSCHRPRDYWLLWLSDYQYFLSAQFPFIGDRLLLITNHDADISSRAPLSVVISEFIHKSPKWTSLVSGESLVVNSASRYQHIAINVVRLKCNNLQLLCCSVALS